MKSRNACLLLAALLMIAGPGEKCAALEPGQVLVLANRKLPDSLTLAREYMKKRGIPAANLLAIPFAEKESCTRDEYEKSLALPVRNFLLDRDPMKIQFRCIVSMYGIPLVVTDPGLSLEDRAELLQLRGKVKLLQSRLNHSEPPENRSRKVLADEIEQNQRRISALGLKDKTAAVDSELSLVLEKNVPLEGWLPNPACLGYGGRRMQRMPSAALLVSRLDGPTPQIVRRIMDDSLITEEKGFGGKNAYFDARWPDQGKTELSGYAFYDRSIHRSAEIVRKSGVMPVVLNADSRLFQPGECPDAAIYCGWYSLGKYVDAFTWAPGAVGYHIASSECTTLKKRNSTVWCKVMLEKGVAATIGPVGEPYVQAFPPPELFFKLLLSGKPTLAECFALSNPFLSWKIILVGDPLYRPFKSR
ncbi:MAG: TIGR03790 family protein [Thermodesulfobacteriota bacterium]